jgi:calcineurin-like phosphoesterase family protein
MNIWMLADHHLDHANIIKYEDRPFAGVEEMSEEIIKRHNAVVSKDDKVFFLGDVGFGKPEHLAQYIKRMNGRKTLILGNHDISSIPSVARWLEAGFVEVSRYPILFAEWYWLSHEPLYMNEATPYVNVFGHVHSNDTYKTISKHGYCVSIERHDYRPVNFKEIQSHYLTRKD